MSFIESKTKAKSKQGSRTDCSAYLRFIPIIEKLVSTEMLAIDLREIRVAIDYRLHLNFMDNDKAYLAFFDKIRAYMNYQRGLLQVKRFIEPNEKINFTIFRKTDYFTVDGKESSLTEVIDASFLQKIGSEEKTETLLVGYATDKELEYIPFEEE